MTYKLLDAFRSVFEGKTYKHRQSNLGDYVASFLFEDLVSLGRSPRLLDRVRAGRVAVNTANLTVGRHARRGDGTFGEVVPGNEAVRIDGFVVPRASIATIEIGVETKILAKAMIKQIDRVVGDLQRQASLFQSQHRHSFRVAIVGINSAGSYVSFEGEKRYPTDGRKHKHPFQEAAAAERRVVDGLQSVFDELLILRFRATNQPPFPFEWTDEGETRMQYGAALVRLSSRYERGV